MDQARDCKRLHAKGMSQRAIARELGVARDTVRAYVTGERHAKQYRNAEQRSQPTRELYRNQVIDLLKREQALDTPRKQRLTASQIQRALSTDETPVSYSSIRRLVKEIRLALRDPLEHAFLPLSYRPGEDAQVDFFEGDALDPTGQKHTYHFLLVRMCYSGRTFAYAAPNQTRQALIEGLIQSFEFFGGVPQTLWFDNLTPAVRKVLKGRNRQIQERFEPFIAHYGFNAEFCSPGKGNEKGAVENVVKYARHEILSPMPTVTGREDLQRLCNEYMQRELTRTMANREESIGALFEHEKCNLIPLPSVRFDPGVVHHTKVSPRSWVQNGTNYYSAPVEWVGHEVVVKIKAEEVSIHRRGYPVVRHRRSYGKGQMVLELDHYLPLLERKSRGLDRSVPYRQWARTAPQCFEVLLHELRKQHGEVDGTRQLVNVLMLYRHWKEHELVDAVEKTLRCPDVSLAQVRFHLRKAVEDRTPAVGSIDYAGPLVWKQQAADYAFLCKASAGVGS